MPYSYPANTLKDKMILLATPIAWLLQVKWNTDKVEFAKSDGNVDVQTGFVRFLFDNLASQPKLTIKVQGASASTGENIDINRADGAIIRFPKNSLIISGKDESLITETANDEYASGLGDLSLVTNEADLDSVSFTAMINKLKEYKDEVFLGVIPTGFTYQSRYIDPTITVDGFVYQLYRITTDIDFSATTLTIGLSATKATKIKKADGTSITAEELEAAITAFNTEVTTTGYKGIKLKGTDATNPACVVPKKMADAVAEATSQSADATALYNGDMVIISQN